MTPDLRHAALSHRPRLDQVSIDDAFWSPRIETIRTSTLPFQLAQFDRVGHFEALSLNWTRPDEQPHIFWDSDVAKWIEAASYQLETRYDETLDRTIDAVIERVARAQQSEGYLNSYFGSVAPEQRFTDLRDAHELYCAGHLIEAAVAHYEATGKTRLLDVMRRYADLIDLTFGRGDGQLRGYDGHEEIELALIKLYRATRKRRYLDLARYFVDERGREPYFFDLEAERRGTTGWFGDLFTDRLEKPYQAREYLQAHLPVREQTEVVGHAVRAVYLLSAVTDLADLDDDDELQATAIRLWNHVTERRLYLTGGIGSSAHNEGFTSDFDLPDFDAYSETCAAIGLMMWATRMVDLDEDGRYVDVLERALYNNVLAGANTEGTCFFYDNPLASAGDKVRSEWFGVACCPPNLARLMSSLGRYVYAQTSRGIRVDLALGSTLETIVSGRTVRLAQTTTMPWEGESRLLVAVDEPEGLDFEIAVRIPGWAGAADVEVNGETLDLANVVERGYARILRSWRTGDEIVVRIPVEGRRVWGRPEVESAIGRVSLMRGPFVYCVEEVDNVVSPHVIAVPRDATLDAHGGGPVGVTTLAFTGQAAFAPEGSALYTATPPRVGPVDVVAVPYFSWGNRGRGLMRVWLTDASSSSTVTPKGIRQ